jgi:hypothetical protein
VSSGLAVAQGIVLLGYRITSVTDHPFCVGALWTAARWHHTCCLSLSFRGATKKEVAYAFMAVQPCANEVMQLHLEWFLNWHDRDDRDNLTGLLLLTWLAAQAEGLRSLSLYFSSLPVLPSLPNLQHLILHLEFADFVASMRVLPLFKSPADPVVRHGPRNAAAGFGPYQLPPLVSRHPLRRGALQSPAAARSSSAHHHALLLERNGRSMDQCAAPAALV